MGKIIVCNTKTAQNPYTFLNTCLLYTNDAADD